MVGWCSPPLLCDPFPGNVTPQFFGVRVFHRTLVLSPSLLDFPLHLSCVLAFVVVDLNYLLFLLWTCPTRQAGTDIQTVTGSTREVVFDLNDLTL